MTDKRKAIPLQEYNLRQQILALTDRGANWTAGEELHHQPNSSDEVDRNALFENWVKNGGQEKFRKHFRIKGSWRVELKYRVVDYKAKLKEFLKAEPMLKRCRAIQAS